MNAITLLLVCGSVWGLFQLLAVLIGWRFTKIRPSVDAVLQERGEAISGWDSHVDTALEILLTHEATPEVDEFGRPERWAVLEEEFADLDGLAAKLGERAA